MFQLKRAYDPVAAADGYRVLVERLWPRGVTKEKAAIDLWLKEVAPSTELRQWFGHDPKKWPEFQRRYRAQLQSHHAALQPLLEQAKTGTVTLVYASKDQDHNSAIVLKEYVEVLNSSK
ncbi:MAG: DUF488 domain-containing protein [Phycisphaerae bacterium]